MRRGKKSDQRVVEEDVGEDDAFSLFSFNTATAAFTVAPAPPQITPAVAVGELEEGEVIEDDREVEDDETFVRQCEQITAPVPTTTRPPIPHHTSHSGSSSSNSHSSSSNSSVVAVCPTPSHSNSGSGSGSEELHQANLPTTTVRLSLSIPVTIVPAVTGSPPMSSSGSGSNSNSGGVLTLSTAQSSGIVLGRSGSTVVNELPSNSKRRKTIITGDRKRPLVITSGEKGGSPTQTEGEGTGNISDAAVLEIIDTLDKLHLNTSDAKWFYNPLRPPLHRIEFRVYYDLQNTRNKSVQSRAPEASDAVLTILRETPRKKLSTFVNRIEKLFGKESVERHVKKRETFGHLKHYTFYHFLLKPNDLAACNSLSSADMPLISSPGRSLSIAGTVDVIVELCEVRLPNLNAFFDHYSEFTPSLLFRHNRLLLTEVPTRLSCAGFRDCLLHRMQKHREVVAGEAYELLLVKEAGLRSEDVSIAIDDAVLESPLELLEGLLSRLSVSGSPSFSPSDDEEGEREIQHKPEPKVVKVSFGKPEYCSAFQCSEFPMRNSMRQRLLQHQREAELLAAGCGSSSAGTVVREGDNLNGAVEEVELPVIFHREGETECKVS